jgi:hypothetical protein
MNSLTRQVQNLVEKRMNRETKVGNKYKSLTQKYNELLEKGWVSKRESQMPTISQKLELVDISQMSYNRG